MKNSYFYLSLCVFGLLFFVTNCGGGGSSCDGTTFVNMSGESVTVSANENSGIQFSTFTLEDDEEKKICGDDENDIMGDYEWESGATSSKGLTWSGADLCIYLMSDYSVDTGDCT